MPRVRLTTAQTFCLGFALLILLGAVLLALPFSSNDGSGIPFLNALFTATSASCVTGLAVYDTATQFSTFGQIVLLCLIQIGGLGFMTFSLALSLLLGSRISLRRRSFLMESIGALELGSIVRLARRAIRVTLLCEGGGAVALALWFIPRMGPRGLWLALFHSVSAYCNAGFDLFGTGASLITVADSVYLNCVLMFLIISGGLGFLVWDDLLSHGKNFHRWRLHSKLAFTATVVLFAAGAVLFFLFEQDGSLAALPLSQKILASCFQSVTARTAGFCTVPLGALRPAGLLLMLMLMFVGAGSGSTGGGVKVTTLMVLFGHLRSRILQREDVTFFDRQLPHDTIHKAYSTAGLFLAAALAGSLVLCAQGFSLEDSLFECISAIGTVGLTHGITAGLPVLSRLVIIMLMYSGRVGSMSVAMMMTNSRPPVKVHCVTEDILIG